MSVKKKQTGPMAKGLRGLGFKRTRNQPDDRAAMVMKVLTKYFESRQKALDFARAFAGVMIEMPSMAETERMARAVQTVRALERDPSSRTVNRLAEVQGVEARAVRSTFKAATGVGISELQEARKREREAEATRPLHCRHPRLPRGVVFIRV